MRHCFPFIFILKSITDQKPAKEKGKKEKDRKGQAACACSEHLVVSIWINDYAQILKTK